MQVPAASRTVVPRGVEAQLRPSGWDQSTTDLWKGTRMTDIASLRELAKAATPGPWTQGDLIDFAGVLHDDECAWCQTDPEVLWRGVTDINGRQMKAHGHRNKYPNLHQIYGGVGDIVVAGNYDWKAGGIVSETDAAYIAAVSPDVLLSLLDELERLRERSESPEGVQE